MTINLDINTFFGIAKNAVIQAPMVAGSQTRDAKCKRLQTFAVLRSDHEISHGDNLGKTITDKDKNFFWARLTAANAWSAIKWEYPLLSLRVLDMQPTKLFDPNSTVTWNVEVMVVDQYGPSVASKDACELCDGRTLHEVLIDVERHLTYALRFMAENQFGQSGGEDVWVHKDCLPEDFTTCGNSFLKKYMNIGRYNISYFGDKAVGIWTDLALKIPDCSSITVECNPEHCTDVKVYTGCTTC